MSYNEMRCAYEVSRALDWDVYIGSHAVMAPTDFLNALEVLDKPAAVCTSAYSVCGSRLSCFSRSLLIRITLLTPPSLLPMLNCSSAGGGPRAWQRRPAAVCAGQHQAQPGGGRGVKHTYVGVHAFLLVFQPRRRNRRCQTSCAIAFTWVCYTTLSSFKINVRSELQTVHLGLRVNICVQGCHSDLLDFFVTCRGASRFVNGKHKAILPKGLGRRSRHGIHIVYRIRIPLKTVAGAP